MSAQVAELVPAIEAVEGGLLSGIGVEGEGRSVGGEVCRFARIERVRIGFGLGLAWMGEERCQAASDVAPSRDRAQVVDEPENAELRERLEHAEVERGRANAAPRQREADWPETLGVGALTTRPIELAALRDVGALGLQNRGKGFDGLPRRARTPGKPDQRPDHGDGDDKEQESPLDRGGDASESRRGGGRLVRMREHLEDAQVLGAVEDSGNERTAEEHRPKGAPVVTQEPHEQESKGAQAHAVAEDEQPIGFYTFLRRFDPGLQCLVIGRARRSQAPGGKHRRGVIRGEGQLQAQQVLVTSADQRIDDTSGAALDRWPAVPGELFVQHTEVVQGAPHPDQGENDDGNEHRYSPPRPLAARG